MYTVYVYDRGVVIDSRSFTTYKAAEVWAATQERANRGVTEIKHTKNAG